MGVEVTATMSKYRPFRDYLAVKGPDERDLRLTFDNMESIMGSVLPRTARVDRCWWANTLSSNHAKSWLNAGWKVDKVNLGEGFVLFVRATTPRTTEAAKPDKRGNYHYLQSFFQGLPTDQRQLALSFDEIGSIIQKKLPHIALVDRPWWANTKSSPQGASWTSAGWQVENVFLKARLIVFRKRGANPLASIPRYVRCLLEGAAAMGRPDNHTLMQWIGFCRRVGWFFEGAMLYERSGLSFDALDDVAKAEAEEHYAVCKRELTRYHR